MSLQWYSILLLFVLYAQHFLFHLITNFTKIFANTPETSKMVCDVFSEFSPHHFDCKHFKFKQTNMWCSCLKFEGFESSGGQFKFTKQTCGNLCMCFHIPLKVLGSWRMPFVLWLFSLLTAIFWEYIMYLLLLVVYYTRLCRLFFCLTFNCVTHTSLIF